jgi:hypothetical protein
MSKRQVTHHIQFAASSRKNQSCLLMLAGILLCGFAVPTSAQIPAEANSPKVILASAPLSDGRLQLWGAQGATIWTTWKQSTDPNAGWAPLSGFQSLGAPVTALAAGQLPDGRVQLFAAANNTVYTCWQRPSLYADWTPWSVVHSFSAPITSLTVAPVSDGRLQLWAVDASGNLYSTWKITRQPGSNWSAWSNFPAL